MVHCVHVCLQNHRAGSVSERSGRSVSISRPFSVVRRKVTHALRCTAIRVPKTLHAGRGGTVGSQTLRRFASTLRRVGFRAGRARSVNTDLAVPALLVVLASAAGLRGRTAGLRRLRLARLAHVVRVALGADRRDRPVLLGVGAPGRLRTTVVDDLGVQVSRCALDAVAKVLIRHRARDLRAWPTGGHLARRLGAASRLKEVERRGRVGRHIGTLNALTEGRANRVLRSRSPIAVHIGLALGTETAVADRGGAPAERGLLLGTLEARSHPFDPLVGIDELLTLHLPAEGERGRAIAVVHTLNELELRHGLQDFLGADDGTNGIPDGRRSTRQEEQALFVHSIKLNEGGDVAREVLGIVTWRRREERVARVRDQGADVMGLEAPKVVVTIQTRSTGARGDPSGYVEAAGLDRISSRSADHQLSNAPKTSAIVMRSSSLARDTASQAQMEHHKAATGTRRSMMRRNELGRIQIFLDDFALVPPGRKEGRTN